ncbi:transposase [Streptomyces sp. NPDC007205]|uniref:transposase n=1 Tax=Streptomyces sp. NPDC007205 TaxID=3154316 RepID=UPI003408CB6E
MRLGEVERLRGELSEFVADMFASVPRRDQRRCDECYLQGLMLDDRRKSIQSMAERLPDGNMQALQQFVNQSSWDPWPVRRRIAQRLCEAIRPEVWVVEEWTHDDGRRRRAGIPGEVAHVSKTQLALGCWTGWPDRIWQCR